MESKDKNSLGLSRWDFLKVAVAGVGAMALSLFPAKQASALTAIWTDMGTYIYPNNWTGFKIHDSGHLEIGTDAYFYNSGYNSMPVGGWPNIRSYNLLNKSTYAYHENYIECGLSINYTPYGSGIKSGAGNSPQSADLGLYVANVKQNWYNNPQNGEVDGICVNLRNGGQSDGSAYLANVAYNSLKDIDQKYRSYGNCFEGSIILHRDNNYSTVVRQINVFLAGITDYSDSPLSFGFLTQPSFGTIDYGCFVGGTSDSANFSNAFYAGSYVDYGFVAGGSMAIAYYILSGNFQYGLHTKNAYFFNAAILLGNNQQIQLCDTTGTPQSIMYMNLANQLILGAGLASGKFVVNIDGTLKTLSIDSNGFVKAA